MAQQAGVESWEPAIPQTSAVKDPGFLDDRRLCLQIEKAATLPSTPPVPKSGNRPDYTARRYHEVSSFESAACWCFNAVAY